MTNAERIERLERAVALLARTLSKAVALREGYPVVPAAVTVELTALAAELEENHDES